MNGKQQNENLCFVFHVSFHTTYVKVRDTGKCFMSSNAFLSQTISRLISKSDFKFHRYKSKTGVNYLIN